MLPDIFHSNSSSFHHVNQSARRGNKQVAASSQVTYLSANVRPTVHHTRTYVRSVGKLHETCHATIHSKMRQSSLHSLSESAVQI